MLFCHFVFLAMSLLPSLSLHIPPSLRPSPSCSCVCFISLTCSHVLVLVFHPLSPQSIMCVCTSPHVSWFPSIFPSSDYFCVLIFAYFLSLSALGSAPRLTWSATAGLDRSSLSCSKQHQAAVWKVFEQPFHRNRLSYKKKCSIIICV